MKKIPYQVPLSVDRPLPQRLDNFEVGANLELMTQLHNRYVDEFVGIWLHGEPGNGRSHLLTALSVDDKANQKIGFLVHGGLIENFPEQVMQTLQLACQQAEYLYVDDLASLAGHQQAEELVFQAYQMLLGKQGAFIVADRLPATAVDFDLADLNSRARGLMHFQLQPLDDNSKRALLVHRAYERGYTLKDSVVDYWLRRGPRDLGTLLTDLEVLDRATLSHKQTVTVPLLKQVLGY